MATAVEAKADLAPADAPSNGGPAPTAERTLSSGGSFKAAASEGGDALKPQGGKRSSAGGAPPVEAVAPKKEASEPVAAKEPAAAAAKADEEDERPAAEPEPKAVSASRTIAGSLGAGKGVVPTNPTAEVIRACDTAEEVRSSPVKVTELAKELKEQFESGHDKGPPGNSEGDVLNPTRTGSGVALKEHDLVNTANVALVLQAGEFKLRPGVDFVPYEELKELRLEDGLDVSRKEEYLSNEEFEKVLGIDKDTFKDMPAWKRINLKKAKGLF